MLSGTSAAALCRRLHRLTCQQKTWRLPRGHTAAGFSSDARPGTFDPELLKFLGEPLSKKPLRSAAYCITKYRYDAAASELVCDELGLAYPVVDGIPRLLLSAARKLTEAELAALPHASAVPEEQTNAPPVTPPQQPWSQ